MLNLHTDRRPPSPRARLITAALMLASVVPIAGFGQATGSITGIVTDTTGRGVPETTITLRSAALGLSVEVKTNDAGTFDVPLVAGEYQLEAKHTGFQTLSTPVSVTAGSRIERTLGLKVGTLQETITVTGRPGPSSGSSGPGARRERPAPKPCTPSAAGGRIVPPMKVTDVRPIYPESAQGATTPTVVSLEATIGVDGTVTDARATSPVAAEFEQSAITAVRQWEFTPTLLNCEPVEVRMNVSVAFTP